MTTNDTSPSVVARTAGCLWRLIKLFIAIILGILLGVLLYYGGLYAYLGILAPISTNHTAINRMEGDLRRARDVWDAELAVRDERIRLLSEQLEERREATNALEERLNARLADQEEARRRQVVSQQEAWQAQIASLEDQRQALAEVVGDQERRSAELGQALQAQQEALRTQQEALQAQHATLQVQQEALQAQQEEVMKIGAAQAALEAAVADTTAELQGSVAALQKAVEADMAGLEADLGTLQDQISGPAPELVQLREQTLLLKAAAQVLRVRIRLVQNNPGGAKGDLVFLDETLAEMGELPEVEAEAVSELRDQVAELQIALDENPFAVSEQLDVLWLAITDLITF